MAASPCADGGDRRVLRDALGRRLDYLRLSVTDRCNFRCAYCLPDGPGGPAAAGPLSHAEIGRLMRGFAALGFRKVRLTGGEPTLRPDLCELVRSVATVPGIARVGLTTNGWRLADIAGELRGAGLSAVNVSLDSLDPDRFEQVTGSPLLSRVVAGIEAALATGIRSVKVNVVLLPGLEEAELDRFLEWTREAPLSIRFIELMQTGENQALFLRPHMPVEEIRRKLDREGWAMLPRDELDGPAASFARAGHAGQIGIISAYAHGFCDSCNRLRVSSTGDLVLCLFGEAPVPLRPLLQRDEDLGALVDRIEEAVSRKPEGHRLREGCTGGVGNLAGLGG